MSSTETTTKTTASASASASGATAKGMKRFLLITLFASILFVHTFKDTISKINSNRHTFLSIASGHRPRIAVGRKEQQNHVAKQQPIAQEGALTTSHNNNIMEEPQEGQIFNPGSLNMSKLETFQRCYIDPERYKHHFHNGSRCNFSKKHKLAYYMIAKSGSSTARVEMKKHFEGRDKRKCTISNAFVEEDYHIFTFVRDPLSRFFSSYQEMLKYWFRERNQYVPIKYQRFLQHFHKNSTNITTGFYESNEGQRILFRALEQFIEDYDAEQPFNGHLRLQVPRLFNFKTNRTHHVDSLVDISKMDEKFASLAKQVGIVKEGDEDEYDQKVEHVYVRKKRMDLSNITEHDRKKLCQLSAIDYCCLNYPIPQECHGLIHCQWISVPTTTTTTASVNALTNITNALIDASIASNNNQKKELLIQAVSPYPPQPISS